jgi:hypothetical protein
MTVSDHENEEWYRTEYDSKRSCTCTIGLFGHEGRCARNEPTEWPGPVQLARKLTDAGLELDEATEWVNSVMAGAWDEAAEATAEWMSNNPTPAGVPVDPPRNPYE